MPAVVDFLDLQHANNNVHNLRVARWLVIGGALPPPQLAARRVACRVCRRLLIMPRQRLLLAHRILQCDKAQASVQPHMLLAKGTSVFLTKRMPIQHAFACHDGRD